ncbi:MAG TPA: tetratricopeptide repeat protein [Candidatus Hydrogenedentes bacterium]|nr:tetratricopeptide repeat protein [Candidatus Hydrogenedentota bacterium]HOS03273.1 tetratricopeptide repeat protein [Candidatus Hydrogenedentota bacterium]
MKRAPRKLRENHPPSPPIASITAADGRLGTIVLGTAIAVIVLAVLPLAQDITAPKSLVLQIMPATLVAWLAFRPQQAGRTLHAPPVFLVVLSAGLLMGLFSVLFSANKGYALSSWTLPLSLFALYLACAWTLTEPRRIWTVVTALCVSMAAASLYGFLQYAGLDPFPWEDETGMLRSAPATFGNPNYASHALLLAGILAAGMAWARRSAWPLAFVAIYFAHLGLTRTRGTFLALAAAVAMIVVAAWLRQRIQRPSRAVLGAFLAMAALGIAAVAVGMTACYARTGRPYPLDESILLRAHSFFGSVRMIADKPFTGRGPGGYYLESPLYWTPFEQARFDSARAMNDHVHNETLEAAVESGLGGAALYLGFLVCGIGYGLYSAFTAQDRDRRGLGYASAALFTAALIDGQFGFNLHLPVSASIVYLTAGALAGTWMGIEPRTPPRFSASLRNNLLRWGAAGTALSLSVFGALDFAHQISLRRGMAALHWKDPKAAQGPLKIAATLMPQYWTTWYHLGRVCLLLDRKAEAISHFERTLALNPTYIDAHIRIAQQLVNDSATATGEEAARLETEAMNHARRAASIAPAYPGAEDVLARALMLRASRLAQNNSSPREMTAPLWQEAEEHLRKALVGALNRAELLRLLAQTCIAQNKLDEAADVFGRATAAAPDDEQTWTMFFRFAQQFNRYEDICIAAERRIQELSDVPQPDAASIAGLYVRKARALSEGFDRQDDALTAILHAIETAPACGDAWGMLYRAGHAIDQPLLFPTLFHDAHARTQRPPGSDIIAFVLEKGPGAVPDAARTLTQRIDDLMENKAPGDPATLAWTIDILAGEGEKGGPSAAAIGQIALSLGTASAALQQFDKAERLLRAALPYLSPADYSVCAERLGKALLSLQRPQEAIPILTEALKRAPANASARLLLARSYSLTGQTPKARQEYQSVLLSPGLAPSARHSIQQELARIDPATGKPSSAP